MAVTENKTINQSTPGHLSLPCKTGIHHYQGTLAFIDAATGTATNIVAAGANAFAGLVVEECDNTDGSTGALDVALNSVTDVVLEGTGFTQADVGKKIYATDNFAISTVSTSKALIGRAVEFISATQLRVRLDVGVNA